jgi:hypothetical protein
MLQILVIIFLGWPAILASVILSLIGLMRFNFKFLIAAAVLAFGPCWFLSGFPKVASPIFLAPTLVFGAAFAQSRGHEMIAWLLVIPYYLLVGLLAYLVFVQPVSQIETGILFAMTEGIKE